MTTNEAASPLQRLRALGDPTELDPARQDYSALGIGREHVPALIALATDSALRMETDDDDPALWAPVHAWRLLGQLGAVEAAEPLLATLSWVDDYDDEWAAEELPLVYAELGAAAVPALAGYVRAAEHGLWARVAAVSGLEEIGKRHPEARAASAAVLAAALEQFDGQDAGLNGSLVSSLVALGAVEAASLIERAFAAGQVDEMVMGDWEDVQIAFGLKSEREAPRKLSPDMAPMAEVVRLLQRQFRRAERGRAHFAAPGEARPARTGPPPPPVRPDIQRWNAAADERQAAKAAKRAASGGKRKRKRR